MLQFKFSGSWQTGYTGFYYIHTYPDPKKPGHLTPANGGVYSCREFFVRSYRDRIKKGDGFTPYARKAYALISTGMISGVNNLKIAQQNLVTKSAKGLYITNSFEKAHGWPLTKVYPVKCTNKNITTVFFAGPRKWTTSPYLMSIWSLTIRLGYNNWIPKTITKLSHEQLVQAIYNAAYHRSSNNEAGQVLSTIKHWDPFMSFYKELFGGVPRKYHWDRNRLLHPSNDRPEGIRMLIGGNTGYKALHKKYFKLVKEAKNTK